MPNFKFDPKNPDAAEWASLHAADAITGISETTRDEIRDLVEEAMSGEFDPDELATEIAHALGDDARAEVIARTESIQAANQGQLEAWNQALEDGLIGKHAKKVWVTTPDDKLCPICEALDGEEVGLDEEFDVEGEGVEAPPAHPNCRCVVALVP